MIRKLILSFCFLLATLTLMAASIDGIRVESPDRPIIVFIDGQQMCTPTFSCFVANLRGGSYRVEVYAARNGGRPGRENLLYDERVHYSGMNVKDIFIGNDKETDRHPEGHHRPSVSRERVMSRDSFEQFMSSLKKQTFESERNALLDNALIMSYFTVDQCKRLLGFCTFDSERIKMMKKLYPRVSDKPNFFSLIAELTFQSDKDDMNRYIKSFRENN